MAKLEIRCPICSKWEYIEILDDATKNVKKGLLAVNIAPGMICDHNFIAYVDKNLIVRDCFIADFKIETPEEDIPLKQENEVLPEAESIDFDLIKLNIPEKLMILIFKAIFLGRKILILSEDQFLYKKIIDFFKFAIQDLFNFELLTISEESYNEDKSEYEDYIVFKGSNIIHDKNKSINYKKSSIEKSIIQKFLAEYELATGLIILRNEIKKAYEFSKDLVEFIRSSQKEMMTSKILIDHINEKHNEQIQKDYLKFLLEIVKNYFDVNNLKADGLTDSL
jgi:hypothetical protein